ncbi:MAG: hypothetical protein ACRYFU_20450 [Janthinobacterium lividum]
MAKSVEKSINSTAAVEAAPTGDDLASVSREKVANLAYRFWEDDGRKNGEADSD